MKQQTESPLTIITAAGGCEQLLPLYTTGCSFQFVVAIPLFSITEIGKDNNNPHWGATVESESDPFNSMAKQSKYSSSRGNDEVQNLSEKLSNDLRTHIRTLVRTRQVPLFIFLHVLALISRFQQPNIFL